MADKLTDFGFGFQVKIIAALLTDKAFLQQVSDILFPEFFESEANQWIVETTAKYFLEYKTSPTLDVFKIKLNSVDRDLLKTSVVESLKTSFKYFEAPDLEFVKSETLAFCKNQCIRRAILESVDLLNEGKYEEIKSSIDNAMKAGADKEVGHEYNDSVEIRYQENVRSTVATPWPVINDVADGGFGKGELVVFVAPAGIGKCIGPETKIDIQYNEVGISVKGCGDTEVIIWIKLWQKFQVGNGFELYGWEVESLLSPIYYKRTITEEITIKQLFDNIGIADEALANHFPVYDINVKTPYGFKRINELFRTELQETAICRFSNNAIVKCSPKHRFMTQYGWKHVSDIREDDIIETDNGSTHLTDITYGKNEVLYDIAVEEVHCYYSNGVLSHNSWGLINVGAHAVRQGLNVVHYTLELNEGYVGQRYDAVLTGIPNQNLKYNISEVQDTVDKLKGNLVIKYYPTKTASCSTIRAHIEKMILIGKKPDLVIVDYADLLRGAVSRKEMRHELESIYEDLRGIAGEYEVPLFTASQANRCLSLDTIVNIKDKGKVPIKEVNVGDLIETHEGYKSVTEVFPSSPQPVYKIKLKNGMEIKCSSKHEFPTAHGKLKSIETGLKLGDKLFTKKL
jgi:replicative DNA helicase